MSASQETVTGPLLFAFGSGTSEIDPGRKDLLGGKGASLAAMTRAGLPVPPGFTISAECCAYVEQHQGAWPPGLLDQVKTAMARMEATTGRTFGCAPKPLLVAVRSGAAVSMPGMMDTILNCGLNPSLAERANAPVQFWKDYADHIRMFARSVAGQALDSNAGGGPEVLARNLLAAYQDKTGHPFPFDPWDALIQCINAVFASWNSARAVTYRRHHDIRNIVGTAVTVQMMFPSQRAGVLFTANPNRFDAGEMVIEASWGLGEVVVSGAVTPDIFVLDAQTLKLKEITAGDRPADVAALSDAELQKLGELGRNVERHFNVPCDIEWGIADEQLVLLQSRPIRGLDVLREVEIGRQEEIQRLKRAAGGQQMVWVVHNLSETLSAPTPLTWDLVRRFMSGAGGFGGMYRDFGYHPSAEVCREGFLELICGRIYVDPRRAAGLFWEAMPLEYDMAAVLSDRQVLDTAPAKLNLQKCDQLFFLRLPKIIWSMLRCSRRLRCARAAALQNFEKGALPKFLQFVEQARAQTLSTLSVPQLLAELERRRGIVLDDFSKESLKPGFFGGMAQSELQALLVQLLGDERGQDLTRLLTTGLENDTTIEQNVWLYRVAQNEVPMDEFLKRYGHRAVGEMELAQPRWREDPEPLKRMLGGYRAPGVTSPEQRHAQQRAARLQAEAGLPKTLADRGGSSLRESVLSALKEAQRLLPYREAGKHYLMMGYETLRDVLAELSRRWNLGRDAFFLQLDELPRFEAERAELERQIAARKLRWQAFQKLALADVIDSSQLENLGRPAPRPKTAGRLQLEARPIASGIGRGIARLVFDPSEAGDLGTDYILVCPSTDPGWTPLFVNAKGLIVERGGVLSHGAIVARDFGIPAVVCENATRLIPAGARLEIDGGRGVITELE